MPIDSLHGCSFLVVPTSQYNSRVPLLIGTNIISRLVDVTREEIGSRFLQDADLHTSWFLAFRCMTLRERELRRNGHRLGIVKSAETERITIPPNGSVRIRGYLDRKLHAGTGTTTTETHSDQKEDAPDISLSTDGQESEESIDEDQTIEEETELSEDVTDLDTESSETEPLEHSQCEEDPIVPEPAPRRSTRNAHQPKWIKDYVMSDQAITRPSSPEWLQRAAYLQELMVSGMLSSDDKQVTKALVSIIAGK